jgi:cytochrome c-type protein NapB
MGNAVCLSCHEKGLYVGTRQAAKMSHPVYANCTQCHVDGYARGADSFFGDNDFRGLAAAVHGERAFAGAPPVIPHSVWMRGDCLSCHGSTGPPALRTTHPERQNCFQCHLPSSSLDWPSFFSQEAGPP